MCVYGEWYRFGGVHVPISGSDGSQVRVRLRSEGAQSEICGSLGRTLVTLRYKESEGEKKTLRHTGDSYSWPSPSSFEFFRFVLLSLCVFVVLIWF